MKINIIGGSGVMGNVHKKIFESAGHEVIISGRNSSLTMEEASKNSDLTIISVPISATKEVIRKVAPHCKAIMDFTGLKKFSIDAMIKYSSQDCEVGGLHPLYGEIDSVKERTIVYCKTEKSGEKCEEIIRAFELAGAKIKKMNPEEHDYIIGGILQCSRLKLLEIFARLLEKTGLDIKELYELSPPPTQIIIDLISRQMDEKNDQLYEEMKKNNPFKNKIDENLKNIFENIEEEKDTSKQIRNLFGEELKIAQERAKKITKK